MKAEDLGTVSAPSGARTVFRRVMKHIAAMHLSGALLLLTFVLAPPAWVLDAYGDAPAHNPSADTPPLAIIMAMVSGCVCFHVLVQIPSGLLGTRLGRNRAAGVDYALALAAAGVLTFLLVLWLLGTGRVADVFPLWADFMVRGSLSLASYVWLSRRLRNRPARRSRLPEPTAS